MDSVAVLGSAVHTVGGLHSGSVSDPCGGGVKLWLFELMVLPSQMSCAGACSHASPLTFTVCSSFWPQR